MEDVLSCHGRDVVAHASALKPMLVIHEWKLTDGSFSVDVALAGEELGDELQDGGCLAP